MKAKRNVSIMLVFVLSFSILLPFSLLEANISYADSYTKLHQLEFEDYIKNSATVNAVTGPAFLASTNMNTAAGEYIDAVAVSPRTDKSLVINSKGTSGLNIYKSGLSITGKVIFEANIRFSDTKQDRAIESKNNVNGKFANFFKFNKSGKVEINGSVTTIDYKANTWYNVKAVIDNSKGTGDFYLNGVQKIQNGRLSSAADNKGPNTISQIKFYQSVTSGNTNETQMYLDDVSVFQINSLGDPVFTEEIVKGWNAISYGGDPVFAEDPNEVHNSQSSMKITVTDGATGSLYKDYDVKPGERYSFSSYWRGEDLVAPTSSIKAIFTAMNGEQKLQLNGLDVEEESIATATNSNSFGDLRSYSYTAPAGANKVRVQLVLSGPGKAWFNSPELVNERLSKLHQLEFEDYIKNSATVNAVAGPAFSASTNMNTAAGEYIDAVAVSPRTDKSLVINSKGTSGLNIYKSGLSITGKVIFEANIRFSDTKQDRAIESKNNVNGKFANFFKFNKSGKVEINGSVTTIDYKANTWYNVKAVIDNSKGTGDFYLNGVQKIQNGRLSSAADNKGPNTISQIKFYQSVTSGNNNQVQMFLDDILFYQISPFNKPVFTEQYVKEWESIKYAGDPIFEEDNAEILNQQTSLKITANNGAIGSLYKDYPVQPGESYTFSSFWRGSGFNSSYIRAIFTAMNGDETLQINGLPVEEMTLATTKNSNRFAQRQLYQYMAPVGANKVRIQLVFSGPGTALFNDPRLDKDKKWEEVMGRYSSNDVQHPIANPQNMFGSIGVWNEIANEDLATLQQKVATIMMKNDEELKQDARLDALSRKGLDQRGNYESMARRLAVLYSKTGDTAYARKAIIILIEEAKGYQDVPYKIIGTHFFYPINAIPLNALYAYDVLFSSSEWDNVKAPGEIYAGEDVRLVVEGWFRSAVMNLYNLSSPGMGAYDNIHPYGIGAVFGTAAILNDPDMIRLFLPWIDSLLTNSQLYADGFWEEATLSYHEQVINLFTNAFKLLQDNFNDPRNYVDNSYNLNFNSSYNLGSRYPLYTKAIEMMNKLRLPNGDPVAINDTHWNKTKTELITSINKNYLKNIELYNYGLFSLIQGDEQDATFAGITFPQSSEGGPYQAGGHQHGNYLNLNLFGSGMEVIPDPGYPVRNGYSYAYDQMTAPMHNLPWTWSKTANYATSNYMSTRASMLAYDPGDTNNKSIQLVEASELGPVSDNVYVKRRMLMMVNVDGNRSYTLDLSRLKGGEAHQVFMRAVEDESTDMTTSLNLTQQPDADVKAYMTRIDHTEGLPEARSLMKSPVTADGNQDFNFTWTGKQSGTALRAYMNGISGDEVIFSQIPTLRRTNNENAKKDDFPGWHFQRRQLVTPNDTTRFGAVYETWRAEQQPLINSVTWAQTADQDPMTQVAIVDTANYVDTIYISDDTTVRTFQGVNFAGRAAMIRTNKESGVIVQGYIYGAGSIEAPGFAIQGKPDIILKVTDTTSTYNGAKADGTVTTGALTNSLIVEGNLQNDGSLNGLWVKTMLGDKSGVGMRIVSALGNTIQVHDYPTFSITSSGAKVENYPFASKVIPGDVIAEIHQPTFETVETEPETPATNAPGTPVLSHNNWVGNDLTEGSYIVTMNLWWGENATSYKLYEDGVLVDTQKLTYNAPSAQSAQTKITGKANGTYTYVAELTNDKGTTRSQTLTVQITNATPGKAVLSQDNWDGDGNYKVTMNLWWGTNASEYRLYENDELIDTQELRAVTPLAQSAVSTLSGKASGTYTYRAELINAAGVTSTDTITVKVE